MTWRAMRQPSTIVALCAIVLFAFVAPLIHDNFVGDLIINTGIGAGVALAWNLTAGLAGRVSLGQAAFFGIGAYTSTLLFLRFGVTPWLGVLAGMLLAALVAAVIETATMRLANVYYSLATFSIAALLSILARGWREVTAGTTGLTIPFNPAFSAMIFSGKQGYIWLSLLYAALCVAVTIAIVGSPLGYFLRAQRDARQAAESIGIDSNHVRVVAGIVSAALTAIGGTLYAQYQLFIDPEVAFTWDVTIKAALASIIGGMGTVAGPLLGSVLLVPLERALVATFGGSLAGISYVIYGAVLIAVVLLVPRGFVFVLDAAVSRGRLLWRTSKQRT